MVNGSVVCSSGKNMMLNRLLGIGGESALSQFGIGSGTSTPADSDTGLTNQITGWNSGSSYAAFNSSAVNTSSNSMVLTGVILSSQANGNTISEVGTFNTDGTPVICTHDVFTGIAKTSSVQLFITWTVSITD